MSWPSFFCSVRSRPALMALPKKRLLSGRSGSDPIPYSKSPAKGYSVRDSLGLNAEMGLQNRKRYTVFVGFALFAALMYFSFRKDRGESNVVKDFIPALVESQTEKKK
eukprot:m.1353 g.1353  ORF g.1353 m.1353 type:complete len:108 (+) comp6269_c0_seq1:25-348(+)